MDSWKSVWETICKMAYENEAPFEKIIIEPSEFSNNEENTLDYTWKAYSKKHGSNMPGIVPEFKELYVPRILFENLGIYSWFRYSFPNCKVEFWKE